MAWNDDKKIAFRTKAKDAAGGASLDDGIVPWGIRGREKLSRLYEYYVAFTYEDGDGTVLEESDLAELLRAPSALALGDEEGDIVVHGILQWVERYDFGTGTGGRAYVAKLSPTAWLLTQTHTNRVFLGKTAHAIITEVLEGYKLKRATGADKPGYFEIRAEEQAKHDYVVQYEESDWDFVQRWLEREGLFYWFEQRPSGERLIISDTNPKVADDLAPVFYHAHHPPGPRTITSWHAREARTPARVALLDYNYETPTVFISGKADVASRFAPVSFGTVFSYGQHLKDADDAGRLAKLRAELHGAAHCTYRARGNFPRLRAGTAYTLDRQPECADYLITAVEHEVGIKIDIDESAWGSKVTAGNPGADVSVGAYSASLEAIPLATPYRPERVTPWPRIDGVISAHIEEDTDGKYAQLDAQGRYVVKLPFDLSGRKGTKASHWIRMAEPYSGNGYGVHYPLHKGAEVLLAHIGGDPDRPVIIGAAPNPATKSPVTRENSTQSVVRTASGVHIEMEDLES